MSENESKKAGLPTLKGLTENEKDSVHISRDVIAVIAGMAAGEIDGVAGMSSGIVGGITERLGLKDVSKGVQVSLEEEDKISIELSIVIEVGAEIKKVVKKLQEKVRSNVENITGLKVNAINVQVLGINVPREKIETTEVHAEAK